jgi:multidrug efflux pump
VIKTIFEAAFLVSLVVLIFLQSWRATLVPVVAMVVSIIGTFAGMYLLGFSLNTLTLFGLVLAIGIVVDDAIVVIENVERNIREFHMSGREAAHKAMEEVSGPVVAIVFVLCAVFIPVAFLGGIAGQLYKQFAITISVSVVISGLVALTLSPALAALLLKPQETPSRFALHFNRGFDRSTAGAFALPKNYYSGCLCINSA